MTNLSALDYIIIVCYLIVVSFIGLFFHKKATYNSKSYFLGNRKLPWWAICVSMIAVSFAPDTPLAITEMVRQEGLQKLWWPLIRVMMLIAGVFLFSRLWSRCEIITDAEFYELRYEGKPAALLRGVRAFVAGIIKNLVTMAWVTFAMGSIISVLTGLNKTLAVSVCIAVALTYSTISGFYGVVYTDLVHLAVAIFSMLMLAIITIVKLGGLDSMLHMVVENSHLGSKTISLFPDLRHFDMDMIKMLIYVCVLCWSDAGGYNMQKISACRDEKDAVKATLGCAIFQTTRLWLWVVIALASIVLFRELPKGYSDTHAYAMVMNIYLIPGFKGLMVIAFFAAYMSTIDTHLNWGASYVTIDLYKRFIKPNASKKHYIIVAKISVILLMLSATAIIPLLKTVTSAWEFLAFIMLGSGIISVVRWFWWRINAFTELVSIFLGILMGAINCILPASTKIFGYSLCNIPFEIRIGFCTIVVVLISLVTTFLTPEVSRKKLEHFYFKVRPGGFWGKIDPLVRNLPGQILSFRTILDVIAGMLLCYGVSLGIGYAILLNFKLSLLNFLLSIIGFIWISMWYKKEFHN